MTPIPTCIAHSFAVAVRPAVDLVLGLADTIDLVSGKRPVSSVLPCRTRRRQLANLVPLDFPTISTY
jgi:hypothetical protein